jgi:catechol 2,3-dioxygenase-like lactoylglutathione lyase family enzyme
MSETELNLVVLRSTDLERSERFYRALGILLAREQHGTGPEHFAGRVGHVIFEIYPQGNGEGTTKTRIGFSVISLTNALSAVESAGGTVISNPHDTKWGRRAVVADPDGHRVDLVEAP